MEAYEMSMGQTILERNVFLRHECDELRELISDMHALLQRTCESRDECGRDCELWPDHDKQCDLRDIEDRMAVLGIEVRE